MSILQYKYSIEFKHLKQTIKVHKKCIKSKQFAKEEKSSFLTGMTRIVILWADDNSEKIYIQTSEENSRYRILL